MMVFAMNVKGNSATNCDKFRPWSDRWKLAPNKGKKGQNNSGGAKLLK
jgi:hypothetical protein